jgi:hypothetical protein
MFDIGVCIVRCHFESASPLTLPAPALQGEEWKQTAMAESVDVFQKTFLTDLWKAAKNEVEGKPKGGRVSDTAW